MIVSAPKKSLKAEAKFNHRLAGKVVPCRRVLLRVDRVHWYHRQFLFVRCDIVGGRLHWQKQSNITLPPQMAADDLTARHVFCPEDLIATKNDEF